MEKTKKNWWLKLPENFYEKDEIKMIEAMPEGAVYINFYFKILLKSLSNDGELLFKDTIPYTPEMLSSITNTPVATVKYALDLFIKLGLLEIINGETLHMIELKKMVGCETKYAEKKREYRLKEKEKMLEDKVQTKKDNVRQETRVKSLELRKTTTSESEEKEKVISSSPLGHLDLEEFSKLNKATKERISKLGLSETKIKAIYKVVEELEKRGAVKDFNAYLYSALSKEWDIKETVENKTKDIDVMKTLTNGLILEAEAYNWDLSKIENEFEKRSKKYPELLRKMYLEKLKEYFRR